MKTNLPNFDEAKLTAYALNELDAAEMAEVENLIATNPDAKAWVEDVRQTATLLEAELKMEECPSLTSEQARALQQKIRAADAPSFWKRQWFPQFRLVEALAVVAIVAVLAAMLLPSLSVSKMKSKKVALLQEQRQVAMDKQLKAEPQATQPVMAFDSPTAAPATMAITVAPVASVPTAKPQVQAETLNYASAPTAPELPALQKTPAASTVAVDRTIQNGSRVAGEGGRFGFSAGGGVGGANLGVNAATRNLDASSAIALGDVPQSISAPGFGLSLASDGAVPARSDTKAVYRLVQPEGNPALSKNQAYVRRTENAFLTPQNFPLSTFSIDVDTASYANVRRFLTAGQLPPRDAVRIEELVNYFHYNYPQPHGDSPFAANIEIAGCPWNTEHRLVRIGLKGREIAQDKRPPSNFVFLIDVSGSMQPAERLPLIKQALRQLVKKMTANDRVAIVIYAGAAGVKLPSTSCAQKEIILQAIDELGAGGSTAGAAGIQAAYDVAQENFIKGGVNRVLLCTDGDFNVGVSDQNQLVKIIQEKAKSGVALTTLGVGTDNYKDALMQKLADKGNGNYAYLDTLEEAQKVLIDQMSGTLVTIAKGVKIQVEFNPAQVAAYRLIGYEKRMLRKEDFNNDKKDAGEIGAGHTVTALYEVVPAGAEIRSGEVDDLKYQHPADEKSERYASDASKELLTLKLRYKQPNGDHSRLLEFPVTDGGKSFARASGDFKFAAAVAEFGMLLHGSEFAGNANFESVLEIAQAAKGTDAEGYRSEFLTLVKTAQRLAGQ